VRCWRKRNVTGAIHDSLALTEDSFLDSYQRLGDVEDQKWRHKRWISRHD
jgi:hypothetical protein